MRLCTLCSPPAPLGALVGGVGGIGIKQHKRIKKKIKKKRIKGRRFFWIYVNKGFGGGGLPDLGCFVLAMNT